MLFASVVRGDSQSSTYYYPSQLQRNNILDQGLYTLEQYTSILQRISQAPIPCDYRAEALWLRMHAPRTTLEGMARGRSRVR